MRYLFFIVFLFMYGCIDTSMPDSLGYETPIYPPLYMDYHICEYSQPYNYLPQACASSPQYGIDCCTWDVGWDCVEEWCIWGDSCSWEYDGDYCIH
jgi:hypothetical protein